MTKILPIVLMLLVMGLPLACSKSKSNPLAPGSGESIDQALRRTKTPTPTRTPTKTRTPSTPPFTSTPTQRQTPPATPTWTPPLPLFTPTSTPTGCAKVFFYAGTLPANPVSASVTTAVGMRFSTSQGGSGTCYQNTITNLNFIPAVTGGLTTGIQQVQLWMGSTLLGTSPFNASGFSFAGSPICNVGTTLDVKYVLNPGTSGSVKTTLSGASGKSADGLYPISALYLPISNGPLTITTP